MEMLAGKLAEIAEIDRARAELWSPAIGAAMAKFEISTTPRISAFIAQIVHESGGFAKLEEELSYTPERIRAVWPTRFSMDPAVQDGRLNAEDFGHSPQKLANVVYANRMGNGSAESGDGWKFRGRGLMQITGRNNYKYISDCLGVDLLSKPEQLLDPEYAALSAAAYWSAHGCNEFADEGTPESFRKITHCINGGEEGQENRERIWNRAIAALGRTA